MCLTQPPVSLMASSARVLMAISSTQEAKFEPTLDLWTLEDALELQTAALSCTMPFHYMQNKR